jgi:hypothetical protein
MRRVRSESAAMTRAASFQKSRLLKSSARIKASIGIGIYGRIQVHVDSTAAASMKEHDYLLGPVVDIILDISNANITNLLFTGFAWPVSSPR